MLRTVCASISLALVVLAAVAMQYQDTVPASCACTQEIVFENIRTREPLSLSAILLMSGLGLGAATGASYGFAVASAGGGTYRKGTTMTDQMGNHDDMPEMSFEEAQAAAAEAHQRDLAMSRRRASRAEIDLKRLQNEHDSLRNQHEELENEHDELKGEHEYLKGRHRDSQAKLAAAKEHLERAADLHRQGQEAAEAGLDALRGAEVPEEAVRH